MATAYDNWKLDNGIDDADEARDEWIAERAAEMVSQRIKQDEPVEAAITYMQSQDEDGWIAAALRRFFIDVEATDDDSLIATAACNLWRDLRPHIAADLLSDAQTDAAKEYDAFHAEDGSEAREAA